MNFYLLHHVMFSNTQSQKEAYSIEEQVTRLAKFLKELARRN